MSAFSDYFVHTSMYVHIINTNYFVEAIDNRTCMSTFYDYFVYTSMYVYIMNKNDFPGPAKKKP